MISSRYGLRQNILNFSQLSVNDIYSTKAYLSLSFNFVNISNFIFEVKKQQQMKNCRFDTYF